MLLFVWFAEQSKSVRQRSRVCWDHHFGQPDNMRISTDERHLIHAKLRNPESPFWWRQRNGLRSPGYLSHRLAWLWIKPSENSSSLYNPVKEPALLLTNTHFHLRCSDEGLQKAGGVRSFQSPYCRYCWPEHGNGWRVLRRLHDNS